jgi:hypothetical protein
MSTDRQIEANRLNAQSSTGPRTLEGKARVSSNALRHGLTGRDVVLPNENPDDYDSFRPGLLDNLNPYGDLEALLADKIVIDAWRIRRIPILEAAVYRRGQPASFQTQAEGAPLNPSRQEPVRKQFYRRPRRRSNGKPQIKNEKSS